MACQNFLFNCVPERFLPEKLPHGLTAAWHFRVGVWIPNLGALPIIASVSLTHIPCLFACLHESVSRVYMFFPSCLSICVLRTACLVFCSKFHFTFCKFKTYIYRTIRCTHNIGYMTIFVPLTSLKNLVMFVYTPITYTQSLHTLVNLYSNQNKHTGTYLQSYFGPSMGTELR